MNSYKNIETWNCKLDFFQDTELDDIIPDLAFYNSNSEELVEAVVWAMRDIVEESLSFSCGYHTSGDAYRWAMMSVHRVDFRTLAKEIIDEYYS